MAIALGAVGAALFSSDPRAALAALEESLALTDAGASDVIRNSALIQLATVKAGLGDARGTLECLREGFEHSVAWGDRATFGALAFGVAPLVEIGQPELAVVFAAAATFSAQFGGESMAILQRALTQARQELGAGAADELSARVEAMSWDDMVHYVRAELERAIESTPGS